MANVRIGFVGVGGMGQAAHLQNYIATPECEVTAIAELRPQLGQQVATRWGVKRVYSNHRDLLKNEELDGIVAIQPFGMHADLIPELLEKKVPVLTEKPLSDTVAGGEKIMAAMKRLQSPLYLAYHKRSDVATQYARRQIEAWQNSGEVGKFRYVRISMPPGDWIAHGFWQLIHTDEKYDARHGMDNAYGRFVNYYIHQVNLMRFLFGEDYEVLFADPAGLTMSLRSASGVSGTLEMATHTTSVDWQEEAFISFERGWIKLQLPAPLAINRPGAVTVFKDSDGDKSGATTTTPTLPWIHAMRSQAANFVRAIKGESHPLCPAVDGLKDLRVAEQYIELLEHSTSRFMK